MAELLTKPSFEKFVQTCTPLYKIPELEKAMRDRIQDIVKNLLDFQPSDNPVENLKQFLQKDKNFIGVILALTNLSQEKFLRIISAKRFSEGDYGNEWGIGTIYSKIRRNDTFAEQVARLFIEGRENRLLSEVVPDFYLDQLSLPPHWSTIIRDQKVIGNVIRKKLAGEYSDLKGEYVERKIIDRINQVGEEYGFTHAHGQVQAMALGKEVDIAIPSLDDPYILIMVSYMETTSSNQTTRANEQNNIYQRIVGENVRYNTSRVFINIIDGAGWLARRKDLLKMFKGCHYCLNINGMEQIEAVILKYLPKNFCILKQPPDIKEIQQ